MYVLTTMNQVKIFTTFLLIAASLSVVNSYISVRDLEEDLLALLDGLGGGVDADDDEDNGGHHGNHMDDEHGGIPMGEPEFRHGTCDDGKTDLRQDWDGSVEDYTCMETQTWTSQRYEGITWNPKVTHMKYHSPRHVCMEDKITYSDDIPTAGAHRPLWPKYGEYLFLPPQRYLHSLEHGAIVAMYHPCTDPVEIEALKVIVEGCLNRHIITPNKKLTKDRPIAVLAWMEIMLLPYADEDAITAFIQKYAFEAPEKNAFDGQFEDYLLSGVAPMSTLKETKLTLC